MSAPEVTNPEIPEEIVEDGPIAVFRFLAEQNREGNDPGTFDQGMACAYDDAAGYLERLEDLD